MDLLRFVACGSVDDGKSTLIGRLLYDTRAVLVDTLEGIERSSRQRGLTQLDLSLLTDGLTAEREQGITIDVAYRYFSTGRRSFIIADAPGHEQYTRNMVTAASTADVAVLLVDVRQGLTAQTRRHAILCDLLGVRALFVAVNKMDLVDYAAAPFAAVREAFESFATQAFLRAPRQYVPISALMGDMVVERGERLTWYDGPTLLAALEAAPTQHEARAEAFRFPVQWVCRPQAADDPRLHDYRGYAGQVLSGSLSVGDVVRVLPAGHTTQVVGIELGGTARQQALADDSVMLLLADDLDVSRGDMIVRADEPGPVLTRMLEADLAWLANEPLAPQRVYGLRHTTREVKAKVEAIAYRLDVTTLAQVTAHTLGPNDIARVRLRLSSPIAAARYEDERPLGAFLLVDPATGDTLAGGMIRGWEE